MSIGLPGVFASTTEVAVPPEITGAWESLGSEAAVMADAAGFVQTAVAEAAGSWSRLVSSYDESSTNAVVHRAMDPLIPRAGSWSAAMAEAGSVVEDFAQQARQLQARAEELGTVRGEVLRAAAEIEAGDSWVETWWQRLRVAEFNAAVVELREAWEQAQQNVGDQLAAVERAVGADGARSHGAGSESSGSLGVADEAALGPGSAPAGGSARTPSGGAAAAEGLVDELAGEDPETIIERLDDGETAAAAAALADRRLDAQFALPGGAARRMREVMATHDHRTDAGMQAIREGFLGLEAEQQRRLVVAYPTEFGNLNGIPLAMRARANAVRVAAMRHRLGRSTGREASGADAERRRTLRAGLDQAARQIAAGKSVVHLSARGHGEIVVMDGTPTTETERTLIHVPGTGADPGRLDDQIDRVEALDGAAQQGAVSVSWQGAELPQQLIDNIDGLDPSFALDDEIERGARNLAAFDHALDLEVGEQTRSTVSAHSAGTAYMGRAAHRDHGLTADALIYIAPSGPGKGVSSSEDLADPSTEVFMVEARDDAVDPVRELLGWQGIHGRAALPWQDPMEGLEAIELEPGAADRTVLDDGDEPQLVSAAGPFAAHSGVLDEDTHAVESIRAIVSGGDEQVLPLYDAADPRLLEGLDEEEAVRRRLLEDHEDREDWVAVEDLSHEAAVR
ncbi:alpha/beta hydrolase [Nesterenkonia sp. F]|uniref:alpha/beta hydrolase n=1 Tax=Nesterenkonia sp. F TaxID=795955 RepID=UPI000255D1F7|nr:alpha/beta hydrolase [Nesterenkonia sp. F]